MAPELTELAERFLPSYLFPEARRQLLDDINAFPHNRGYYTNIGQPAYLQGDGWTNFIVLNFDTGERRPVSGIVLSNSCDIVPDNRTVAGQRVVFAPIINLHKYINLLRASGRDDQQIDSTVGRLVKQHVNNAFYLPAFGQMPEGLVLLDDLHSEPLEYFWTAANKQRLIRLSDFGFWLFVLKLSIHFTRLQEEIQRGSSSTA